MLSEATRTRLSEVLREHTAPLVMGRVARVGGLLIEVHLPGGHIGDVVHIERAGVPVRGEVVGFSDVVALVLPFSEVRGIAPGARVHLMHDAADVGASKQLLGRIIDPFGRPLDRGPPLLFDRRVPIEANAPSILERTRINKRFETGVRVIDGLLTCGRGQRVGVFAGAGIGKTVLIRQILAQSQADVAVVGLIGERGVEVADLLSSEMASRIVIVAATSDRSPMERVRGARTATALAEAFRDDGLNVLLVIDSLTRYAMALREIGLASGEPPATKGYPPSVFAALPRLLERAGPVAHGGSVTGFYTVLVEGDDMSDPIADSARSLLDAHIVLSRDLASRGHFPAVDVLASASRVALQVTTPQAQQLMQRARATLATRREVEELRNLGAYVPGVNPAFDEALLVGAQLDGWSRQDPGARDAYDDSMAQLAAALVPLKGGHAGR